MLGFYQMLLSIIPEFIAELKERPKRSSLSGYVMLSNSITIKDPKKYIGDMIMVYLPSESAEPISAKIKSFRNGKVFVTWTDSAGMEYRPYPLDPDNLIKEYAKKEPEVQPVLIKMLKASDIDHSVTEEGIYFCNGTYSLDIGDSIVLYHMSNPVARYDTDKAGLKRLISKCKEIDYKFFSRKNTKQRREVREHNEHLDSLYDTFYGDGNVTVRVRSEDF